MTEHCKYCGDAIKWAVTEKRKNAPVQVDPLGTLILLPAESGRAHPRAVSVPLAGEGGAEVRTLRYSLHLPVCPAKGRRR